MSARRQRQIERYMGTQIPHTAATAIGRSRRYVAERSLPLHTHDVHEICFITHGCMRWTLGDDERDVSAGSLFFTPPRVVHGSRIEVFDQGGLAWLQVDCGKLTDTELARRLRQSPPFIVQSPRFDEMLAAHERLMTECQMTRPDSPSLFDGVLKTLASDVLRSRDAIQTTTSSKAVAAIRAFIADASGSRVIGVADLQKATGLGRTRVHQLCRRHFGRSPGELILQARIHAARIRLSRSSQSVTQIAFELGFSSSQHLAAAFKKHVGMTPTAYRKAMLL
ncbi:MAG: AraC family transcriptional regulator [Planctomycetota bacterium]